MNTRANFEDFSLLSMLILGMQITLSVCRLVIPDAINRRPNQRYVLLMGDPSAYAVTGTNAEMINGKLYLYVDIMKEYASDRHNERIR